MAQVDARDAQEKRCHPFFTDLKNRGSSASTGDRSNGNTSADRKEGHKNDSDLGKQRVKRRKTQTHHALTTPIASLPPSPQDPSTSSSLKETDKKSQTLHVLLRARPSQHDVSNLCHEPGATAAQSLSGTEGTETARAGAASSGSAAVSLMEERSSPTRKKKYMRFNSKTGMLASPSKSKSTSSRKPSLLVCVLYGADERSRKSIGERVTQILQGLSPSRTLTPDEKVSAAPKPYQGLKHEKAAQKATHPFFAGGAKPPASQEKKQQTMKKSPVNKHSISMSTPVSPAKEKIHANHLRGAPPIAINAFRIKVPGARHPMWPTAGMSHVRNDDSPMTSQSTDGAAHDAYNASSKKSKGHTTVVKPQEFIIADLIDRLRLDDVHHGLSQNEDNKLPPAEVRLPQKRFESGRKLQRKVKKELACTPSSSILDIDSSSEDELASNLFGKAHAASKHQYQSLVSRLSAFDGSNCENLAWSHKYAPTTAHEVLQVGPEVELLKQWLLALRVQSVESKGEGKELSSTLRSARAPRKKRKKQMLEGFIVNSDDDASEMDAVTESEDDETMTETAFAKKSFVRSGDLVATGSKDQKRLKNCVLISGPHGCGKTAAVYAVAKELQFEVFEINASSRRSGKDVCEKVGDMTRNHLVQDQAPLATSVIDGADKTASSESHKQGTMKTFLKPKSVPKKKPPRVRPVGRPPAAERQPKDASSPTQKQSLILLEEADVLFEEDRQFWATVMSMMAQSKRPFIITCNEEKLIPMQSLSLHGIFRFSPPPASLATDLCLLIAAAEGHILSRKAVEALYHSRDRDLRATIAELNFWCQIGVGDRRGGFDWFLPRWPRGSDLDEKGDVIRVISQGTYLHGMGWTGHDHPSTTQQPFSEEEDQLLDVWESRQLDPAALVDSLTLGLAARTKMAPGTGATLESLDQLCSAFSDADICAAGSFAGFLQEQVDQTLPALPSETIEDFTMGRELLEADPLIFHTSTSARVAIALISRARSLYEYAAENGPTSPGAPVVRPIDQGSIISILDKSFRTQQTQLTRSDVSIAFDPLAASTKIQASTHLDASVFDRPLDLIVVEVAPWVRGIMAFEHQLMQERLRLSNLLSESGQGKRMRTTRSAYSALEGGERRTTRREKYFGNNVKVGLVMRTGSESFKSAAAAAATAATAAMEASKLSDWGTADSSAASTQVSPG